MSRLCPVDTFWISNRCESRTSSSLVFGRSAACKPWILLKRLGLQRTDLIDTQVTTYPQTREWAEWLHGATPAKGLASTSRQDDGARAVALFDDRLSESAFKVEVDRELLCQDERLDALLELAGHIGIERLFGL